MAIRLWQVEYVKGNLPAGKVGSDNKVRVEERTYFYLESGDFPPLGLISPP